MGGTQGKTIINKLTDALKLRDCTYDLPKSKSVHKVSFSNAYRVSIGNSYLGWFASIRVQKQIMLAAVIFKSNLFYMNDSNNA